MKMRNPVVGKKKSHDQIEDWSITEPGDEGEVTSSPAVAQDDLDHGGEAAGGHRDHGCIEGSARFASSASVGELIVNFNNPAGRSLFGNSDPNAPNYSVINTDYTSYSVVYMCRPIAGIFKKESLWLLTRDAVPSDSTVETALEVMRTNNLPLAKLSKTSQTGCEALP